MLTTKESSLPSNNSKPQTKKKITFNVKRVPGVVRAVKDCFRPEEEIRQAKRKFLRECMKEAADRGAEIALAWAKENPVYPKLLTEEK